MNYLFAIEIGVTPEGSTRTSEGKHGQRHWYRNIHTNLNQTQINSII